MIINICYLKSLLVVLVVHLLESRLFLLRPTSSRGRDCNNWSSLKKAQSTMTDANEVDVLIIGAGKEALLSLGPSL